MSNPTMGPLLFNSIDLEANVPGLTILSLPVFIPPQKTLANYILSNTNKSKTTQNFFTKRQIPVTMAITRPSRTQLDGSFDALWPLLSGLEQDLITIEGGTQRRYTATWSDFSLKEAYGGYAKFDVIFTTSDMFGYEPNYTLLLDQSGFTTSPQTPVMADIGGSAEWQVPILTFYLSVITGGASATVTIGNPATGQTVSIVRTWTAGDQIEIDSQNKTVKVNGVLVDFSGAIPEWQPRPLVATGQSKMQYTDTFTTRTLRIRGIYYKRYA